MTYRAFSPFSSSNIRSIAYDADSLTLRVSFLSGGVYEYYNVPLRIADEFERAASKGTFLAAHIKGQYRYSRV